MSTTEQFITWWDAGLPSMVAGTMLLVIAGGVLELGLTEISRAQDVSSYRVTVTGARLGVGMESGRRISRPK